jgi:hypothetical protein
MRAEAGGQDRSNARSGNVTASHASMAHRGKNPVNAADVSSHAVGF